MGAFLIRHILTRLLRGVSLIWSEGDVGALEVLRLFLGLVGRLGTFGAVLRLLLGHLGGSASTVSFVGLAFLEL